MNKWLDQLEGEEAKDYVQSKILKEFTISKENFTFSFRVRALFFA